VFKAHGLVYHSTLGLRVIKKKKTPNDRRERGPESDLVRNWILFFGVFFFFFFIALQPRAE